MFKSFLQKLTDHNSGSDAPAQSPVLGSAVRFPFGPFQFKSQIAKGISYEIEASTNLKNWSQVAADTSLGEIEFLDSNASKFDHRFYRLHVNEARSANVIGFATVVLPPLFSMIANPLKAANNNVAELLKGMPEKATLSKFDSRMSQLVENTVKAGKWTNPTEQLVPGEGAIFFNPNSDCITLNFIGDVVQGNFSTPIPSGFSIRSSMIPQPGTLHTDLGFPASEGDVIHLFDRDQQKYVLYPYDSAAWASNPPIVSVGESFWAAKKTPKNWIGGLSGRGG